MQFTSELLYTSKIIFIIKKIEEKEGKMNN